MREPTWRHRWPHNLATLKVLTPDGVLPATWHLRLEKVLQAPDLTWGPDLIARAAAALVEHRKNNAIKFTGKKLRLTTWNVNGMTPGGQILNCDKTKAVRRLTQDAVTILTETKWDEGDDSRLMTQLGGCEVYHSPALRTEAGGKSGGVAIIVPTHSYGRKVVADVIMHNYAIMITITMQDSTIVIVGVYAPPLREAAVLRAVFDRIALIPISHTVLIAGDFNQAPQTVSEWDNKLSACLLQDCTPAGLITFRHGRDRSPSTLDRVFCRHVGLECGTHICRVSASRIPAGKQEHAKVHASISPIRLDKATLPQAPVIPAAAFSAKYSPSQELARRLARIEGVSTQNRLDNFRAETWQWWKAQPKTMFKTISTNVERLHAACQQRGPFVSVLACDYQLLCQLVGHHADDATPGHQDRCHIPRPTLLHLLDMLNLQKTQENHFQTNDTTIRKIHWVKGPSPIWARLKAMNPKGTASLTALNDPQGQIVTDPVSIEQAVRATRHFWTQDPPAMEAPLADLLDPHYVEASATMAELLPPSLDTYRAVIIASNDSSPGMDGLPYAVYRLVPGLTVELLELLLEDITNKRQSVRVPNPMLVWIPKATAGLHPDNWRPLGLGTTFHRLLAGGIYYSIVGQISNLLHPSQALLNTFREPQHNFLVAHEFLHEKHCAPMAAISGVLVTDFVKAFELVNPHWIMAVLRSRNAPNWLVHYVEFTLFGRIISPKIRNLILTGLRVKVGVDMGSPLSPLLFCLALDPLIVALNRIPRIRSVRAYMDDNQSAVTCLTALATTQAAYDKGKSAGLCVTQHSCCLIYINGACPSHTGVASWQRAARTALRLPGAHRTNSLFRAEGYLPPLTWAQVHAIAAGFAGKLLTKLVLLPCQCKTKTAFIPACPLTHEQFAQLDQAPWGGRILASSATVLGLPLTAPFPELAWKQGARRTPRTARSMDSAFGKALGKVAERTAKLRGTLTPLPQLALAFPAWIQSTLYYAASVFTPSKHILHKIGKQYALAVLGRCWISGDKAQEVMSAVGIAGGVPIADSVKLAHVGFCMRRDSPEQVIGNPPTDNRRQLDKIIVHYRNVLRQEDFDSFRDTCVSIHSTKPREVIPVLTALRKSIRKIVSDSGMNYLQNRCKKIGWIHGHEDSSNGLSELWLKLKELPLTLLSPYIRVSLIRWLLDAEPDDGMYWHKQTQRRSTDLCMCGELHDGPGISLWYPYGYGFKPIHSTHWQDRSPWHGLLDASSRSWALEHLPIEQRGDFSEACTNWWSPFPPEIKDPEVRPRPHCPLCGTGESSVHHWLTFCPIVNVILKVIRPKNSHTRNPNNNWLSPNHKNIILVANTIFHIRHELIALRAFGHGRHQDPLPISPETRCKAIERLVQTIVRTLPLGINTANVRGAIGSPEVLHCQYEHYNYAVINRPQLQTDLMPRRMARAPKSIVTDDCRENAVVLATHCSEFPSTGLRTEHGWLPPPRRVPPEEATAALARTVCPCGCGETWQITTTRWLNKGQELTIPRALNVKSNKCLLFAFDGSTKTPHSDSPSSGCGIYGWQIVGGKPQVIYQAAIPLPEAANSFEAEAMAAAHTITAIREIIDRFPGHSIEIQGDNAAIVQFWKGEARLSSLKVHKLCEDAITLCRYHLPHLDWTYIPRECNKYADYLAGLASQALEDAKSQGLPLDLVGPIYDALPATSGANPVEEHARVGRMMLRTPGKLANVAIYEKHDFNQWAVVFQAAATCSKVRENFAAITALYKRAQLNHQNGALHVSYSDKASGTHAPFGRLYPSSPSITSSRIGKLARVLLASDSHVEIDIQGSHFGIWLSIVNAQNTLAPAGWFRTVTEHRAHIRSCLSGGQQHNAFRVVHGPNLADPLDHPLLSGLPKYLPIRVLNGGAQAIYREIQQVLLFVPPNLISYINTMLRIHAEILRRGVLPQVQDTRITPRNATYFALEYLEGIFMHTLTGTILAAGQTESVCLIHDGIFVSPPPAPALLAHAVQKARRAIQAHDLEVKVTPLEALKERACKEIQDNLSPSSVGRLGNRQLPYAVQAATAAARGLHNARPQPPLVVDVATKDTSSSLQRFFERKRKAGQAELDIIDLTQ